MCIPDTPIPQSGPLSRAWRQWRRRAGRRNRLWDVRHWRCALRICAPAITYCARRMFLALRLDYSTIRCEFGEISFVPLTDLDAWRGAYVEDAFIVFGNISNPLNAIADLAGLAEISRELGAILAVDNCFCTPALQQPLALGADIVTHSATKYLDGQGRVLGGALVGRAELIEPVVAFNRSGGPTMSAFNAWVMLKGLETLDLRMRAHCRTANLLAQWLVMQPAVSAVHYCGLPEHPGHEMARRNQKDFGAVLAFEVSGGKDAAWRFINGTELMSLTANLGDAKTTVVHPASTTHGRLSGEQRQASGIADGLIRIAVGLEDLEDLQADCERGFAAIRAG